MARTLATRTKLTSASHIGLAQCRVTRPNGWGGAIERVESRAGLRAFPTRVTGGLGICLKCTGNAHEVVADGRKLVYPPGAICIRRPGCAWRVERTDASFISVDCDVELLPKGAIFPPMAFVDPAVLPDLIRLIDQLTESPSSLARSEALTTLFERLLAAGVMCGSELQEPVGTAAVSRARDLLVAHVAEDLPLDNLARHVSANKFGLIRAFRRHFGVTPHAYQVALRVDRARAMIARRVPPALVAAMVGFADQSHLGRHFMRIVGVTPGQYAGNR